MLPFETFPGQARLAGFFIWSRCEVHPLTPAPFVPREEHGTNSLGPTHPLGRAGYIHDLGSAPAIGSQKNDFRSPNVLLWAVAVGHHRLKLLAVGGTLS